MGVLSLGAAAAHVDIDGAVAHFDRERIEVIASAGETATAAHVVAPTVPVTRQNSIANAPAGQRISHVRALIIGCVDVPLVLKQRHATPFDLDRFRRTFSYVFKVRYLNKTGLWARHCIISLHCANTSTVVRPSAKRIAVWVADPLSFLVRMSVA